LGVRMTSGRTPRWGGSVAIYLFVGRGRAPQCHSVGRESPPCASLLLVLTASGSVDFRIAHKSLADIAEEVFADDKREVAAMAIRQQCNVVVFFATGTPQIARNPTIGGVSHRSDLKVASPARTSRACDVVPVLVKRGEYIIDPANKQYLFTYQRITYQGK